jgi:branched-subunit amino acid transport protein
MSLWVWLLVVCAGLATLAERACFSMLPAAWRVPQRVQDWLEDALVAVFAALFAPGLLEHSGTMLPTFSGSRMLAVVVGGYVAWHTRQLWLALLLGVAVFWLDVWVS